MFMKLNDLQSSQQWMGKQLLLVLFRSSDHLAIHCAHDRTSSKPPRIHPCSDAEPLDERTQVGCQGYKGRGRE